MAKLDIYADTYIRLENLNIKDVKKLVLEHGKMKDKNLEIVLEEPAIEDPKLREILNNPYVEVRSIGDQTQTEEMYYDLRAVGKLVRIKVSCKHIEEKTKK